MRFSHTIEGSIDVLFPEKQIGSRRYQEFWMETFETVPQTIRFQIKNELIDEIGPIQKGESLRVIFSIGGKPTQGRNGEARLYCNNNVMEIQRLDEIQNE